MKYVVCYISGLSVPDLHHAFAVIHVPRASNEANPERTFVAVASSADGDFHNGVERVVETTRGVKLLCCGQVGNWVLFQQASI